MKIGVLGGGSWGSALASLLAEDPKNQVILWAYETAVAEEIRLSHSNSLYLPSENLSPSLLATDILKEAVERALLLVNAVPSQHTRKIWEEAAGYVSPKAIIVNASKGFEIVSTKRLSEVLKDVLPQHSPQQFVTLSGPSFAKEVLHHQPTSVVIAGMDSAVMKKVQALFRRPWFLTYLNEDIVGVEVGGATKNVIAIGSGICEGMGLGLNTRAALITRGLYEMAKLGKCLGANPLTFAGLSGMGDLVLTCTGEASRNHTVGLKLGQGEPLPEILKGMRSVAEGIATAKAVFELIQKFKLTNPVCIEIYKILHLDKSPSQALKDLLALDLNEEFGGLLGL